MAEHARHDEDLPLGFTLTRVFDAERERVWREWTEPERFADWFGGPQAEVPIGTVAMDVRPGGAWRATMFFGPAHSEIRWAGEYREVAAPERLVLTITDRPEEDVYDLVTVDLRDLGDGRTEMVVEQYGRMRPDEYDRAKSGWGVFFDLMAARLAAG
jgi:uncharacterized protein YndB with AHSA1/START domain